jgi:hypothetical protein
MKYARIIDDVAVDVVSGDPAEFFHPDIAGQFVSVHDEVVPGSRRNGSTWTAPPEAGPVGPVEPPGPQHRTLVTRTEYYGLFSPVEEAMIRLTAAEPVTIAAIGAATGAEKQRLVGIASLAVMLSRTDALGPAGTIDLANHQVQQGLDLLAGLGLLTTERAAEIKLGVAL